VPSPFQVFAKPLLSQARTGEYPWLDFMLPHTEAV